MNFILESRALLDVARMSVPLASSVINRETETSDFDVMVLPGFGAGDISTYPIRKWLSGRGLVVDGWGLGVNRAGLNLRGTVDELSSGWRLKGDGDRSRDIGVPLLADRTVARVLERYSETGRTISLVGWSLGGYLAREAARDLPDIVNNVVTFGSPIVGGPKYTAAAPLFRARGQDLDWIEKVVAARDSKPITQPVTVIYSPTDAVVPEFAAIDRVSAKVNHIEVDTAHTGLGFNPDVWNHVYEALINPPS